MTQPDTLFQIFSTKAAATAERMPAMQARRSKAGRRVRLAVLGFPLRSKTPINISRKQIEEDADRLRSLDELGLIYFRSRHTLQTCTLSDILGPPEASPAEVLEGVAALCAEDVIEEALDPDPEDKIRGIPRDTLFLDDSINAPDAAVLVEKTVEVFRAEDGQFTTEENDADGEPETFEPPEEAAPVDDEAAEPADDTPADVDDESAAEVEDAGDGESEGVEEGGEELEEEAAEGGDEPSLEDAKELITKDLGRAKLREIADAVGAKAAASNAATVDRIHEAIDANADALSFQDIKDLVEE